MRFFTKALAPFMITCFMFTATLNFNACSEPSPLQPVAERDQPAVPVAMHKPLGLISGLQALVGTVLDYPQKSSVTVNIHKRLKAFAGGAIAIPNGSRFNFDSGALTPPDGRGPIESVTVCMEVNVDSAATEMIFTFGPSGSAFNPPADLVADWSDLNLNDVKFYYIDEEGNYIEQRVEHIDYEKKLLKAKVGHFSRYAVAWSR